MNCVNSLLFDHYLTKSSTILFWLNNNKSCNNYSLSIELNHIFSFLTRKSTKINSCSFMKPWQYCFVCLHFPGEINVYAVIIWPGSCDSDYSVCFSRHHGRGPCNLLCYRSAGDAHQFCCLLSQGVSILVRLPLPLM